jgi:hypothetical protein
MPGPTNYPLPALIGLLDHTEAGQMKLNLGCGWILGRVRVLAMS